MDRDPGVIPPVRAPSPARERAAPSPVPASGAGHAATGSAGLIALQRSAGNAAVAAMLGGLPVVQRCGPTHPDCGCPGAEGEQADAATEPAVQRAAAPGGGGAEPARLRSDRFVPSAKLELCFQDRARLRRGDPDSDAVLRIQNALLALPPKTGRTYDLGEKGPDGSYGPKTGAAVVKFKTDESLGSTQFDDVGPGTMRRLDELFAGGEGPLPPCPVPLDVTASFADSPGGGGGSKAKVGAAPIPGVNCQIGPTPVPPTPVAQPVDYATIPEAERRRTRVVAADVKVTPDFDTRYSPLDRGGNPAQDAHVGTVIFAPVINDPVIRGGLTRVTGALQTSSPPILAMNRTVEIIVRAGIVRVFPGGPGTPPLPGGVVMPGGVFRFTRFRLGTADTTLVERIGDIPPAPGPAPDKKKASDALRAKFANLVFVDDLMPAAQLPIVDAALTAATRAIGQLPQWELDISPGAPTSGEDGFWDTTVPSVDPILEPGKRRGQQLKLFGTAFRASTDANRPGNQEPAFWVVIHEVGHGIAFRNPGLVTRFTAAHTQDGANPVTDYGAKAGEAFPEALALFYADPAILRTSRPATFAFMSGNF